MHPVSAGGTIVHPVHRTHLLYDRRPSAAGKRIRRFISVIELPLFKPVSSCQRAIGCVSCRVPSALSRITVDCWTTLGWYAHLARRINGMNALCTRIPPMTGRQSCGYCPPPGSGSLIGMFGTIALLRAVSLTLNPRPFDSKSPSFRSSEILLLRRAAGRLLSSCPSGHPWPHATPAAPALYAPLADRLTALHIPFLDAGDGFAQHPRAARSKNGSCQAGTILAMEI